MWRLHRSFAIRNDLIFFLMTGTAKWLFSHMYVVSMDMYACFLYVYACPHEIENMCAQLCIQMCACICGSQTMTYDCLWPNVLNQDSHLKLRSPILVLLAKCSEDPRWCLSPACGTTGRPHSQDFHTWFLWIPSSVITVAGHILYPLHSLCLTICLF